MKTQTPKFSLSALSASKELLSAIALSLLCSGCSGIKFPDLSFDTNQHFKESGSIILSRPMPVAEGVNFARVIAPETGAIDSKRVMAPLLGYFPPSQNYLPAVNENWLEISKETGVLTLYEGKKEILSAESHGVVTIPPGEYYLSRKEESPKWYASDEYYRARGLSTPPDLDSSRFLRGALGDMALYPASGFPIHSSSVWTSEVGGLCVSERELGNIFRALAVGAPIVVR